MKKDKTFRPDRVLSYFKAEWLPLAFVTLSGLVYNIGLLATPWFEGRLAQCLADILGGSETAAKMAMLVLAYIVCDRQPERESECLEKLQNHVQLFFCMVHGGNQKGDERHA